LILDKNEIIIIQLCTSKIITQNIEAELDQIEKSIGVKLLLHPNCYLPQIKTR